MIVATTAPATKPESEEATRFPNFTEKSRCS